MPGETNLAILIRHMKPKRNPGRYVFCVCKSLGVAMKHDPLGVFQEREGVTAILPKRKANEAGLIHSIDMAWITLTVHSSLNAVGLTAAVSAALTNANISCNVVAAYFHDHIFIPEKDAGRTMEVLMALTGAPHEQ